MEKDFLHQEYEVAQAGADIKEGTRKSRIGKIFTTAFFSFSILITVGAVAFTIMFFISEVVGSSMMTTLNATANVNDKLHDNVLVNKYAKPEHGDIVVVKHTWDANTSKAGLEEYFIKRVIGLGGDRIRFNRYPLKAPIKLYNYTYEYEYKLVVNGIEIEETYLNQAHWGKMVFYGENIYNYIEHGTRPYTTGEFVPFRDRSVVLRETPDTDPNSPSYGYYEIEIKPGEVFLMGDNRGSDNSSDFRWHSYDSTEFGPQPTSLIEGVKVDKIAHDESIPSYILRKIEEFFSFKWLF